MNVSGLITEFNPFHNGHKYYIEQTRKITGADYLVAVMSGNFTQRGEPACIDKYERARMALSCGIDLVLELPVCYAAGSAEYFAAGAVDLLSRLGVTRKICFGSECGNIRLMTSLAEILLKEPLEFKHSLKLHLKTGKTFPAARAQALSDYIRNSNAYSAGDTAAAESCLQSPNNILGIEYIKALIKSKSPVKPVTISRLQNDYHDRELSFGDSKGQQLSSATSIRQVLSDTFHTGGIFPDLLLPHLPESSYAILKNAYQKTSPVESNDFSLPLHYRLLLISSPEELMEFQDISPDLANRIYRLIPRYRDFDSFTEILKTKQITQTRARRALLHILLNIRKYEVSSIKGKPLNYYARVLGFRKDAAPLLTEIKKKGRLPLITKLADSASLLSPDARLILSSDLFASNVYHCAVCSKFRLEPYNEHTRQIVIL